VQLSATRRACRFGGARKAAFVHTEPCIGGTSGICFSACCLYFSWRFVHLTHCCRAWSFSFSEHGDDDIAQSLESSRSVRERVPHTIQDVRRAMVLQHLPDGLSHALRGSFFFCQQLPFLHRNGFRAVSCEGSRASEKYR
jgi:hypothetical protein